VIPRLRQPAAPGSASLGTHRHQWAGVKRDRRGARRWEIRSIAAWWHIAALWRRRIQSAGRGGASALGHKPTKRKDIAWVPWGPPGFEDERGRPSDIAAFGTGRRFEGVARRSWRIALLGHYILDRLTTIAVERLETALSVARLHFRAKPIAPLGCIRERSRRRLSTL
jgi:hypothetical protein